MSVKFLIQGTIAGRVKRKEYEWKVIEFLGEFFSLLLGRNAVSIFKVTSSEQRLFQNVEIITGLHASIVMLTLCVAMQEL